MSAHDQAISAHSENDLQLATQLFCNTTSGYNFQISKNKPKVMAFEGTQPRKSKTLIKSKLTKLVSHFNYLGRDVSRNYDVDSQKKLNNSIYVRS
jgi:hypothetical protein